MILHHQKGSEQCLRHNGFVKPSVLANVWRCALTSIDGEYKYKYE